MTKKQREYLAARKRDATEPKSELMHIENMVRRVSAKQADRLGRIIGALEAWQNSNR